MSAFEWFESVRREGERIARVKEELAMLDSRLSPRSQGFEPMGHGGGSNDAMVGMALVSARLGELRRMLPLLERRHEANVQRATHVLYGRSGHGGLARATSTDDADVLRYHYLQGEGWASITRRFDVESTNLSVWSKCRARKACRDIDRIGMDALMET